MSGIMPYNRSSCPLGSTGCRLSSSPDNCRTISQNSAGTEVPELHGLRGNQPDFKAADGSGSAARNNRGAGRGEFPKTAYLADRRTGAAQNSNSTRVYAPGKVVNLTENTVATIVNTVDQDFRRSECDKPATEILSGKTDSLIRKTKRDFTCACLVLG